ncbi:MAG: DUF167 domain-containing protein [Aquificaceae bacterium]
MIIKVKAKPRSKTEYVKKMEEGFYEVAVREAPEDGKANDKITELLAQHFGVSKSKVKLLRGASGKLKLFEILNT